MKLVEFREYLTRSEAEIALNLLSLNGFDAVLQSDDLAGQNPSLGLVSGYQLMVIDEQIAEIEAFLAAV